MTKGPLEVVGQVAEMLDELGIAYALGGSMASSLVGEPRSTVDVDIAIALESEAGAALLERASAESTSRSMPLVPQSTHTLRSISSIPRTV
jgi:hypothetical protein